MIAKSEGNDLIKYLEELRIIERSKFEQEMKVFKEAISGEMEKSNKLLSELGDGFRSHALHNDRVFDQVTKAVRDNKQAIQDNTEAIEGLKKKMQPLNWLIAYFALWNKNKLLFLLILILFFVIVQMVPWSAWFVAILKKHIGIDLIQTFGG